MQANLEGDLHHQTAQHECRIVRRAADRKGPCTEQAKRLNHHVTLGDIGKRCPEETSDRTRESG